MNTLEKKLKISENTCIHCPTLELAKQVLNIFHKIGLKWSSGEHYTLRHNWDAFKENTLYYPFEGGLSALGFANLTGYKVIDAEKFIALHTEGKEFDLENYEPKGQLIGFPKEIIAHMLESQKEQMGRRDVTVFENNTNATMYNSGFDWNLSKEGLDFWFNVINKKNFNLFFEKYPKQDNQEENQQFKVGDKVYDIIIGEIGIVKKIDLKEIYFYQLEVEFETSIIRYYSIEGKSFLGHKVPILLHYRDDYNYDVIEFNNLPKRQEDQKGRAENGRVYYFVDFNTRDWLFPDVIKDDYLSFDNNNYNSGNYFRTKAEAEIIAQKLNTYFKQLIKEKHATNKTSRK